MKKIAILLTCYNRKEKTIYCLDSLFELILKCSFPAKFEIYLVDDNSTDGTYEAVKENFPDVKLLVGDGHLYWNRGMYLAWKESSKQDYDFYLWLNDDTVLKNNALKLLFEQSELFNDEAIICGVCESKKSGEITYGGYKKNSNLHVIPNGKPQRCYCFNGNIVLVPRSVYKILGNLDPVFHHGIGDFDYGLRAYENNINSYITSESIGFCERNELPVWCNPEFGLMKRIEALYTPLGAVPIQRFIYTIRHHGYTKAFLHLVSNHVRVLFPSLWTKKRIG